MNISFELLNNSYFMTVNEQSYYINDNSRIYLGIVTVRFFDDIINELWSMGFTLKDQMFCTCSPFGSRIIFTEKDLDRIKLLTKIYS